MNDNEPHLRHAGGVFLFPMLLRAMIVAPTPWTTSRATSSGRRRNRYIDVWTALPLVDMASDGLTNV